MFLPATPEEMTARGWERLDVILVSGDAYIDSPFVGVAVIGRVLEAAGFRVGVIAQPDCADGDDIRRLGEPRLFWGISGGSVDSMVANRSSSGKPRRKDDFSPGAQGGRRPDRAAIAYANLVRRFFKFTVPIVLGGIEASLRRVAHYDFWSDSLRRSILFDAKADFLLYGMAEKSVLALARALDAGADPRGIRGLCHIAASPPENALQLPSFEDCRDDRKVFAAMFASFYENNDALSARPLCQRHGDRWLAHNPPELPLSQAELDRLHELDFQRGVHPRDAALGEVPANATIRFAIPTHRGCYGECNYCSIAVHQGRTVTWRSQASILKETRKIAVHPSFAGVISDLGGPTANMYGFECAKKIAHGGCKKKRCLFPTVCPSLPVDHRPQTRLLAAVAAVPGVRHVFLASGIRHDLVLADRAHGEDWLRAVVSRHTSGQMKVAPEHSEPHVLALMGKPGTDALLAFRRLFQRFTREAGKHQFLSYYLIAGHPGSTQADMEGLRAFALCELHLLPEQTQLFTPTPSTWSTLMFATGIHPVTGRDVFVEREAAGRKRQCETMTVRPGRILGRGAAKKDKKRPETR